MAFVKGKSGNPGGRPSQARQELDSLLMRVWTVKKREAALHRLITLVDDDDPGVAMDAIKLLLAYAYGKPTERKEVTGADGADLTIRTFQVALTTAYDDRSDDSTPNT